MLAKVDNSPTLKKIIIHQDTNTKTARLVLNPEFSTSLKPLDYYETEMGCKIDAHSSSYSYTFAGAPTSSRTSILPIQQMRQITDLPNKKLKKTILITVEPDEDGFIAKTIDLPLYGYGDDREEATNELKHEIESLYDDLMTDDNFTEEWLERKKLLKTWMKD